MTRAAVDWDDLKQRLQRAAGAVERSLAPAAEQIEAVLRRRAEGLAQRPQPPRDGGGDVSVLVFALGRERYAVELARVAESLSLARIAPLPGAPREVAGAIQVRGEIRVVWELNRLLGLPDLEPDAQEYVLIVRLHGGREYGLRVGPLAAIRTLARAEMAAPAKPAPVCWVTPDLVAVLDCDQLFKEEYR